MKATLLLFATVLIMASCTKNSPPVTTNCNPNSQQSQPSQNTHNNSNITSTNISSRITNTSTSFMIDSIAAAQWYDSVGFCNFTFHPVTYLARPDSDIVSVQVSQTYSPTNSSFATWTSLPVVNYLNNGDQFSFTYSPYQLKITYSYPTQPANPWLYYKITVIAPPAIKRTR